MKSNTRFMAKELPENEMETLYALLGKEPIKNKELKRTPQPWSWLNIPWVRY